MTDAAGNVVSTYEYDVWGNVTNKTGTIDTPFGYAGQVGYVYDKETGLYFLKSRYYDAEIGRFTSKDRFMGFENRPASQNRYTYCENDPGNGVDPTGYVRFNLGYGGFLALYWVRWNLITYELNITVGTLVLVGISVWAGLAIGPLVTGFVTRYIVGIIAGSLGMFLAKRVAKLIYNSIPKYLFKKTVQRSNSNDMRFLYKSLLHI